MNNLLLLSFLIFSTVSYSQTNSETAIRNVLQVQQNAWNRGDLTQYMAGYWKNDSLMFIGKSGITYGWQKTLENYKKGYPDLATMGKLNFELIQFRLLSADYYFVVGKWHLHRSIGDVGGHFTLLFRKINANWYIVADHSS